MRARRPGDVLVVWKLDRLGCTLAHLVNTVQDLSARRFRKKRVNVTRPALGTVDHGSNDRNSYRSLCPDDVPPDLSST